MKINIITPEEWNESKNTLLGNPFYPARYHYPKPFHASFVEPIRIDYNTDNMIFLTKLEKENE